MISKLIHMIEYDDDAAVIPRSTSVVARRLPPVRPGKGSAARYVSGKMPTNNFNTSRVEKAVSKPAVQKKAAETMNGASEMAKAQSEEERIEAMFKAGAEQWNQQQQEMAKYVPTCAFLRWCRADDHQQYIAFTPIEMQSLTACLLQCYPCVPKPCREGQAQYGTRSQSPSALRLYLLSMW